jgi:hypothetical protein
MISEAEQAEAYAAMLLVRTMGSTSRIGPRRQCRASSHHTDGCAELVLPLRIHVLVIRFTEKRCKSTARERIDEVQNDMNQEFT